MATLFVFVFGFGGGGGGKALTDAALLLPALLCGSRCDGELRKRPSVLLVLLLLFVRGIWCRRRALAPGKRLGCRCSLPLPLPLPLTRPRHGALRRGVGGELRLPRRPRGRALGGDLGVELGAEGLRGEGLSGERRRGGGSRGGKRGRRERRERGV